MPIFFPELFIAVMYKPEHIKNVIHVMKQFITGFIRVGDSVSKA